MLDDLAKLLLLFISRMKNAKSRDVKQNRDTLTTEVEIHKAYHRLILQRPVIWNHE